MADITEKIILDDSKFTEAILRMTSQVDAVQKEFENMQKSINADSVKAAKAINEGNESMQRGFIKTSKSMREARTELTAHVKQFGAFGFNIQGGIDKAKEFARIMDLTRQSLIGNINPTSTQAAGINRLAKALDIGRGGLTAFVKGLNLIKGAILATGIGALVVGLGSLVALMTQSQRGMDFMARKGAFVGGVFQTMKKDVIDLGQNIVNAFNAGSLLQSFGNGLKGVALELSLLSLSFLGGIIGIKGVKSGLEDYSDKLKKAGLVAEEFENRLQAIRKEESELGKETAKANQKFEEFQRIGQDTAKSYFIRAAAIKASIAVEENATNKIVALEQRKLDIVNERNKTIEVTNAELQQANDLDTSISTLRANSLNKTQAQTRALTALTEEANKALDQTTKSLLDQARAGGLVNDGDARLRAYNEQIKALNETKQLLVDIAEFNKKDPKSDEPYKSLIETAEKLALVAERAKDGITLIKPLDPAVPAGLAKLKKDLADLKQNEIDFGGDTSAEQKKVQKKIEDFAAVVSEKGKVKMTLKYEDSPDTNGKDKVKTQILKDIEDFEDLIDEALNGIFGKNIFAKQDFQDAFGGLKEGFNVFSSIMAESLQIQIDANDKLIEQRKEQAQKLEDELDYELELQKEGLANNVGTKQEELTALLAEQKKYEDENAKLKQQAARQNLIADTAEQASALVTSSIQIIKGFSKIPIIGLALGIAAVAGLTAFFAKTKIDAFKATKLSSGTENGRSVSDYFGFVDKTGDSDLFGGKGYKLIRGRDGKDTGVVMSGREQVIPELVSMRHADFFEALKKGRIPDEQLDNLMVSKRYQGQMASIGMGGGGSTIVNNTVIKSQDRTQKQLIPIGKKKNGKQGYVLVELKDADGSIVWVDVD